MKIELETFHQYVGETLMYCQCIEHDIKQIYAFMADGGFRLNLLKMDEERWTLGQTVTKLKEFDQSWDRPLFSKLDYELLFDIVHLRNYYAHNVYLTFCYLDDQKTFDWSFDKSVDKLMKDKEKLSSLYETVEEVRLRYVNSNQN